MELDIKLLQKLYYEDKLSIRGVADRFGLDQATLRYRAKKLGFKFRSKSQAAKLAGELGRCSKYGVANSNYKDGTRVEDGKGSRWAKYGLTKPQYYEMKRLQNDRCAVCGEEFLRTPHIDHCHTTGEVRGLLCSGCNTGIGHLKDDVRILENAIRYLNKGEMVICY